jgi:phosphatidylglycerophosphate synthase
MTKIISDYLTFRGGEWINQSFIEASDVVKFKDIKFYYANIVDYIRIIMCLIAAYTITTDHHLLSAFLIFTATLLDWLDGPVARAYNQCSLLGCGLDWSADLLGSI